MQIKPITNFRYFWVGAIMLMISLFLTFLPESYENKLKLFGAEWGTWWYYLVEFHQFYFLIIGACLIHKAREKPKLFN